VLTVTSKHHILQNMIRYLIAFATTFLPMCAVTGDNNRVTTIFNISIVPATTSETRP
jgi:hypothetical protein